jgi:hypothetical protein
MSTIPSLAQMKQGYAAYTTYKDLEDRAAATATSMGAAVSDACEAGGKSARGLYDKAVTTVPRTHAHTARVQYVVVQRMVNLHVVVQSQHPRAESRRLGGPARGIMP